uniref:Uncharacterized protein n=1 Tax=Pyricularia oryzae (strain 70-15 / ATCC MYA-4617 / FGSC 8958) TaxID=242507 RepID=Q2KEC7_PYRO7|nr:hypothetical protein MGCH7_ch7g1109 [Pyricularia oryzae 70-15]
MYADSNCIYCTVLNRAL